VTSPPQRKLMKRGKALEKSLAGETTLAAMFTLKVATTMVNIATATSARLSKRPLQNAFGALVAGLAFGQAGTLLHAAIFRTVDLPYMPSFAAPIWLLASAVFAWVVGRGLFSREALQ